MVSVEIPQTIELANTPVLVTCHTEHYGELAHKIVLTVLHKQNALVTPVIRLVISARQVSRFNISDFLPRPARPTLSPMTTSIQHFLSLPEYLIVIEETTFQGIVFSQTYEFLYSLHATVSDEQTERWSLANTNFFAQYLLPEQRKFLTLSPNPATVNINNTLQRLFYVNSNFAQSSHCFVNYTVTLSDNTTLSYDAPDIYMLPMSVYVVNTSYNYVKSLVVTSLAIKSYTIQLRTYGANLSEAFTYFVQSSCGTHGQMVWVNNFDVYESIVIAIPPTIGSEFEQQTYDDGRSRIEQVTDRRSRLYTILPDTEAIADWLFQIALSQRVWIYNNNYLHEQQVSDFKSSQWDPDADILQIQVQTIPATFSKSI